MNFHSRSMFLNFDPKIKVEQFFRTERVSYNGWFLEQMMSRRDDNLIIESGQFENFDI